MKCTTCGSTSMQLIRVMSGTSPLAWAPANGERDLFGKYKQTKPLHAHACNKCGQVSWNVTLQRTNNSNETAVALDALVDSVELEEIDDEPMFLAQDEN